MDGLVYLLNQAGVALAEANKRLSILSQENQELKQENEALKTPTGGKADKVGN